VARVIFGEWLKTTKPDVRLVPRRQQPPLSPAQRRTPYRIEVPEQLPPPTETYVRPQQAITIGLAVRHEWLGLEGTVVEIDRQDDIVTVCSEGGALFTGKPSQWRNPGEIIRTLLVIAD
jgi:hypothetical protein